MTTTANARCIPLDRQLIALMSSPQGVHWIQMRLVPRGDPHNPDQASLVMVKCTAPLAMAEYAFLRQVRKLEIFNSLQHCRLVGQDDYGNALYSAFAPRSADRNPIY